MKKLITLAAIFYRAEHYGTNARRNARRHTKQWPGNVGHVYGKLINDAGKPVAEASVLLMQKRWTTPPKNERCFVNRYGYQKQRRLQF